MTEFTLKSTLRIMALPVLASSIFIFAPAQDPVTTQNPPPKDSSQQKETRPREVKKDQDPKKKPEDIQEDSDSPIIIGTTEIGVPVSITDPQGVPVKNLKPEDFIIEEDGVVQPIEGIGIPGETPLELALLFDVSKSLRAKFDFQREASIRFLKAVLKPTDKISVFTIGTLPGVSVERTGNLETAIRQTMLIEPKDDSTAFFDTIAEALKNLKPFQESRVRQAILVLSDGEDNNSERYKLFDILKLIQESNTLFYAINPSGPSIKLNLISTKGHGYMEQLAFKTGGMAFLPDKLDDLGKVFAQISNELQAQYLINYSPSKDSEAGKYHKITVRLPNHPTLRIRAREGYYTQAR